MKRVFFMTAYLFLGMSLFAHVTLPALFSDHMVLQQNETVTIWGWAKPNEEVTVTASWDPEKEYSIKVDSYSAWSMDIETPAAGGPYQLVIQGYNRIEINDVLIGEVWLGSGQSNMEWTATSGIDRAAEEINAAEYPEIRLFKVHTTTATSPQQLVQGVWVKCSPETMKDFSSVLYFFGRELHHKMQVPVGLISSAWGGTPIEIWTPEPAISGDRILEKAASTLKPVPWGPVIPGVAYNAMIHPLAPYRIKGALWYQGEGNVDHPWHYARALKTMIGAWRASWGYDFSFCFAQIAPYAGYGQDHVRGAILRDQQRKALQMSQRTGMVVLSDIGDLKDIHPRNKQDVGKRMALWALHHDYGFTDLPFSGPLLRACKLENGKAILHFDHAEEGLVAREGELREFEVKEGSGDWVEASARIRDQIIEVYLSVDDPRGIRFAYRNDSDPNLFNGAGLPASCFEVLFPETE